MQHKVVQQRNSPTILLTRSDVLAVIFKLTFPSEKIRQKTMAHVHVLVRIPPRKELRLMARLKILAKILGVRGSATRITDWDNMPSTIDQNYKFAYTIYPYICDLDLYASNRNQLGVFLAVMINIEQFHPASGFDVPVLNVAPTTFTVHNLFQGEPTETKNLRVEFNFTVYQIVEEMLDHLQIPAGGKAKTKENEERIRGLVNYDV
jgi:hypothetical protein